MESKGKDLGIYCSKCNKIFPIDDNDFKNIECGIVITPENYDGLKLACPECKVFMSLKFINEPKET